MTAVRLQPAALRSPVKRSITETCLQLECCRASDVVCFVALRPKSTAMVMAGRSVHLTTHFPGQGVNQCLVHILSLVTDNNPS